MLLQIKFEGLAGGGRFFNQAFGMHARFDIRIFEIVRQMRTVLKYDFFKLIDFIFVGSVAFASVIIIIGNDDQVQCKRQLHFTVDDFIIAHAANNLGLVGIDKLIIIIIIIAVEVDCKHVGGLIIVVGGCDRVVGRRVGASDRGIRVGVESLQIEDACLIAVVRIVVGDRSRGLDAVKRNAVKIIGDIVGDVVNGFGVGISRVEHRVIIFK